MSAMKLDKWDVIIGLIMVSWVISQILALYFVWDPFFFDTWGVDFFLIFLASSLGIGTLFMLCSSIVLLVRAFQDSLLWGLAVLLIPFAALVFIFKHWDESWRPFLTFLLGVALIVIAFAEMPRAA